MHNKDRARWYVISLICEWEREPGEEARDYTVGFVTERTPLQSHRLNFGLGHGRLHHAAFDLLGNLSAGTGRRWVMTRLDGPGVFSALSDSARSDNTPICTWPSE